MKLSNYPIPKELVDFSWSYDDGEEDVRGFSIKRTDFLSNTIHVVFNVYFGTMSPAANGEWQLLVENYRDFHVDCCWVDELRIYDLHPRLLQYQEESAELYYSSILPNPDSLLADIYKAHVSVCGEFISIQKFLNKPFLDACNTPFGLFATGPISVLEKYKEVFDRHGMINNIRKTSIPKHWNGEEYIPEPSDLKLLTMEDTFFIAQEFRFKKLSS